jgi:hypothetical protein
MCPKIRCDEKSEKFCKIFWELNSAQTKSRQATKGGRKESDQVADWVTAHSPDGQTSAVCTPTAGPLPNGEGYSRYVYVRAPAPAGERARGIVHRGLQRKREGVATAGVDVEYTVPGTSQPE